MNYTRTSLESAYNLKLPRRNMRWGSACRHSECRAWFTA